MRRGRRRDKEEKNERRKESGSEVSVPRTSCREKECCCCAGKSVCTDGRRVGCAAV